MKSLSGVDLDSLEWVQRSITEDELVSGNETLAALHWTSSWSSLAVAESAEGRWTFKRVGFIHSKVTIRKEGGNADLYVVPLGWSGEATITLQELGAFKWTPNVSHTTWILRDSQEIEVMRIELNGFVNVSGKLTLKQTSLDSEKLTLLAILGWYVIMSVLSEDAESASSSAIVPTMP